MKKRSIWSEVICEDLYPKLNRNIDVDVLIIGGGITGVSTAYHLIDSGLKVCLVEKNLVGSGVTSRTTGKITYLQEDICSRIKTYHGIEKAKLYIESQKDAIKLVEKIISKEKIECNLEKVSSYVFSNFKEKKLNDEMNLLGKIGISVKEADSLPSNEEEKSFYVEDTYVFHPIKYIQSLAQICFNRGICIYESTKIISIDEEEYGYVCRTEDNFIKTKYVVLAMHYPYFLSPFWMPFKSYLEKSYIEAFRVEKNYKYSAITISKPVLSIRYHSDGDTNYQLYLASSHNLAVKNNEEANFQALLEKNTKPDYIWSNKDIMTIDSLPFIGRINDNFHLLIGTGYNTWGMTNGSLAGKILSDIILHKENKYIELFSPLRKLNVSVVGNIPVILGSSAYSFVKTKISKNKSWYSSNVRFETRNGHSVGVYIDENKREHVVYNTCPHMKCGLIFNEVEKTWDCPCHGSRFDLDGKCIEGPSNYNVTYKE